MRLKSIRVRGLDPYITESSVDFEAIPGPLVAVTGGNGEGKSTLLNFFPAATVANNRKFLKMPQPDGRTLASLSVAKDSFLEVKYEFGQDYTVRHSINGLTGKTDCSVTNGDGRTLLKGKSGVTEFLGWASEHALPPEVFFGSVFSSQGTRGMLGMDPAERKAVILRVIGLERYEKLAEVARKNRSDCDKRLAVVSGKLQELIGDSVAYCEQQVLRLTDEARVANETVTLGEKTLADLRKKNETIAQERTWYDGVVAQKKALDLEEQKLRRQIAELETKLAVNRELLTEEAEITAAVIRTAELTAERDTQNTVDRELRVSESTMSSRLDGYRAEYGRLDRRQTELRRQILIAKNLLANKQDAMNAHDAANRLVEEHKAAQVAEKDILRTIEELNASMLTAKDSRIEGLREGLYIIAGAASEPVGVAGATLDKDNDRKEAAANAPSKREQLGQEANVASNTVARLYRELEQHRRLAASLPSIQAAEKQKIELETELAQVEAEMLQANTQIVSHSEALDRLTRKLETSRGAVANFIAELTSLSPTVARATVLEGAKARVEEIESQLTPLRASLESTVEELRGFVLPDAPPQALNLSGEEQELETARRTATRTESQLAIEKDALTRAQARESRRAELQAEVDTLNHDVADWTRLADDLGKNGVQALSVDAAGPELTTLANDLLRASGDTRFSLKVETTRMDSTGKREIEDCVIQITDSRKAGTKTGASGGEESYINKALAFALTMMACHHAGLHKPTIIDDEGDAALDVEYTPRYVSMLRRAAELMDASKVLFVTHRPDSWNLADSRLVISGGKVEVT